MKGNRLVLAGVIVLLGAWGESSIGKGTLANGASAPSGPHANAVTKQFSIEMNKLIVDEKKYVDGLAMRLKEGGAGAILTEAPLDACARMAAVARGNLDFKAATYGDKPALLLIRNEEHPDGAILLVESYSTTTLADSFPGLVTEGPALIAKGDVGDAGWGSIDASKYGGENAPRARMDVDLPYASLAEADPVAADASAEAVWLRDLQSKAKSGTEAVVDASLVVNEEDYESYSAKSSWFDILGNWSDLSVVALGTGKDCATLVLREPGFSGGYREAIVATRMIDGVRKVTSAQTQSIDSVEGSYVIGRIEHAGLGGFPVMHARAAREEGVGLVVYFSDKPFTTESFDTLVARQRMLRAVASAEYSGQYSFSYYDIGGPGVAVEQVAAGNSTTNPSIDDKEVAGLIKLSEGGGPRISVNFRLPLGSQAVAAD